MTAQKWVLAALAAGVLGACSTGDKGTADPGSCGSGAWTCDDGTCIGDALRCDGVADCGNG
jgi:hypothetical protein